MRIVLNAIESILRLRFLFFCSAAAAALIAADRPAQAEELEQAKAANGFYEVETKYIFGFTEGSGIGLEGEKEFSPEFNAAFGKRDGSYAATETRLKYEFTPNQYVQVELGSMVSSHNIHNVSGLGNRDQMEFAGWFTEIRYLLLDRPTSPLAVTLAVEPEWHRIDETARTPVENYGLETRINADLELVPDRLFLGSNLLYEPETTRDATGQWSRETTIGASAALSYRITPALVVGGEAWYLQHYGGLSFAPFTGDAVYVGPNFYYQITPKMFVQAAWNIQVGGHEPGIGSLDLTDFPRNRVRLKFAVEF